MAKCDLCGKGVLFGKNVSHSKRRTPRMWRPNLHRATVLVAGKQRHLYLCTPCLKSQQKVKA